MSDSSETRVTTNDDGKHVRTALVIGDGIQGGSIDVLHHTTGELLVRLNLFTDEDGSWFAADVIDVNSKYTKKTGIVFNEGVKDYLPSNYLVAADFRMLEE